MRWQAGATRVTHLVQDHGAGPKGAADAEDGADELRDRQDGQDVRADVRVGEG